MDPTLLMQRWLQCACYFDEETFFLSVLIYNNLSYILTKWHRLKSHLLLVSKASAIHSSLGISLNSHSYTLHIEKVPHHSSQNKTKTEMILG